MPPDEACSFKLTSLDGRPWHYKYDSEVRDLTKKNIWPPIFVWQCHSAGKRHHDHGKLLLTFTTTFFLGGVEGF